MKKIFLITLTIMATLSSCLKDEDNKRTLNEDNTDFKQYLIDNNIQTTPEESGLYYIEQTAGTKYKVEKDDYLNINYSLETITGEIISKDLNFTTKVSKETLIQGFYEGITLMSEGGKSKLLVPSYLGYGNVKVNAIQENTSLIFDIEIKDTYSIRKEKDVLEQYITDNSISIKPLESGVIIIPIKVEEGELIKMDEKIEIVYSASFINSEETFDENTREKPLVLSGEANYAKLIRGFSEALKTMRKGETAEIIIPSSQAYKEGVMNSNYKYVVPPYTSLIFEVEILK